MSVIWLLNEGDTDVMREATSATAIFRYRAKRNWTLVLGAAILTVLVTIVAVLLALGPERSGLWIATRERMAAMISALGGAWVLYLGWLFFKFMPSRNDMVVMNLRRMVRTRIDPLEEQMRALGDEQLKAKTAEFRQRLADGETPDMVRPEAYAVVREASRRAKNHRQFECQLIGGNVIENASVAEMRTGEGKTIVCYVANYMKILQGMKVHMVTVNDYLVKRDADFCRPIFALLDVTVGYITAEMETWGAGAEERRAAYACDITYGTNSEFGFDYLRDNMKTWVREQVQGRLDFTVVDEVDSILIDEARTPLIISGQAHDDVSKYGRADHIAQSLIRKQEQANRQTAARLGELEADPPAHMRGDPKFRDGIKKFKADPFWLSGDEAEAIGHMQYFVVELDRKSAHMTEHGAKSAQQELGIGTFYDNKNMNWPHYIDNALRAHRCYQRDRDYVVQDGVVIIVDEFTGRLMHGRQWSDGLHQAVEAKERVTVKQETQTLATITLQNFFKLYKQLAGMTGTALTEADEFMKIYKLEVIAIPTNRPIRRVDYNDKIYKTEANKFDAIVEEIHGYSQKGYPSDPWSLRDMLADARRYLRTALEHGSTETDLREKLEIVEAALQGFNEGKGEAQALEDGYLKLMGDKVGGRPVLVGTTSVEASEKLSQALTRRHGVEHEVLNARPDAVAREADIVAKAGHRHEAVRNRRKEIHGNVTIATNMAGRGTDIRLGEGVAEIGGLHVLGTERHESRRIDNQLRGRTGRQGDPGSSRFFLALEDPLLKLFMGEWVLKMLTLLGFEEGMAIEDKRLTRGIEKAQKKVEERNFGIRKNLLEYDEVMDYQRKTFYALRQRVVEGRGLSELIWEMIDQTVGDAVERYYDPKYAALCAAEWAGQTLGTPIDADKLDTRELAILTEQVRDLGIAETRNHIQTTFGEYVDPGSPPDEWDARGLVSWAGHYGLTLAQHDVRKSDPEALLDKIIEAALGKIEQADLAPLAPYVDPLYAKSRLAQWAHDKFGVTIPVAALNVTGREDAERVIAEKMRAAYRKREIEYPVGAVISYALERGGSNVNEVYAKIVAWVNRKYRLEWTYEHLAGKNPGQIFQELCALNEDYLTNGKLDKEIDAALQANPGEKIIEWARQRFGAVLEGSPVQPDAPDVRAQLKQCGYEMLRYELTQLERFVLLSEFDRIWKDHMYSMDLLRHSIGLRGYAEQDPKIAYKREGTRLFNEMLSNIRERVTDLIFKVNASPGPLESGESGADGADGAAPAAGGGPAYSGAVTRKADATGAGFAVAAADQQAAAQKQGEGAKAETIRRTMPKVNANDPCPCGSGKKYKKCHGAGR